METLRLRLSLRIACLTVIGVGFSILVLRILGSSQRVIGWFFVAVALACLLHPFVELLNRYMPRGLAVLLVVILVIAPTGWLIYGVVDDITGQTKELKKQVPSVVKDIEHSRFRKAAKNTNLDERLRGAVDAIPKKLAGGGGADAVITNTTRGLAIVATLVLTIFMIISGPRMVNGALGLISDRDQRALVNQFVVKAYRNTIGFSYGTIILAISSGFFAYLFAVWRDIPAPKALGAWVAITDLVPLIGPFIGWLPVLALAAVSDRQDFLVCLGGYVVYQGVEFLLIRRFLAHRFMTIGVFFPAASFLCGLELYGLGGAFLAVFFTAMAVAFANELAPGDVPTETRRAPTST